MSSPNQAVELSQTRQSYQNPVGLTEPNYNPNQWWAASTQADLGSDPIGTWILDTPIVLYRTADGTPAALDNRCPHRWAPLSAGYVSGANIVCGYHGFEFGPDGRCARIPTQETIPGVVRVRSYPVMEQAPFVWIWMGDPALAEDAPLPPRMDWAVDPTRVTANGKLEVGCNYMALKENVLDLSHFGFVHAKTLGVLDWTNPPETIVENDSVTYSQKFPLQPLPALYGVPTGIGCEKPVYRHGWGTSASGAVHLSGLDIDDPEPGPDGRKDYTIRVCHVTTPISPSRCHYWWFFSQDYGHGENAAETMKEKIEAAFDEDKAILEACENLVQNDIRGPNYVCASIACDRPGVQARRMVYDAIRS